MDEAEIIKNEAEIIVDKAEIFKNEGINNQEPTHTCAGKTRVNNRGSRNCYKSRGKQREA